MTTATDFAVPTIWFKSRNEAYLEILGPALYSTLNARTRGLIYWYSRRFRAQCGGDYERANHHFSNPRCTSTGEKSWVGLHINRARIGGSHILALPLGCKAVIAKGIVRTYSTYFDHSLLHPTKISVAGSGLPRYSFSIVIIIIFIRIF